MLKLGLPIEKVPEPLNSQLLKNFKGERSSYYQVGKKNEHIIKSGYLDLLEDIYNFKPRNDDIWLVSFRRSGTTFVQLLLSLIENNLDFKKAEESVVNRFPFLENSAIFDEQFLTEALEKHKNNTEVLNFINRIKTNQLRILEDTTEKRFIKTHLPFSLLPPSLINTGKIIFVTRNPKDVAVSFYNFAKMNNNLDFEGDFSKFWDYFSKGLTPLGSYWPLVHEAWALRQNSNVLFLFYEDLTKNLEQEAQKITKFLGKKSLTNNQIEVLKKYMDVKSFRKVSDEKFTNLAREAGILKRDMEFIRKGDTGDWKNYFDKKLKEEADKWIAENLKDSDLVFPVY